MEPSAYRFLRGERDDAPILLPVVCAGQDSGSVLAFCRSIAPQSSVLLPLLEATPNWQLDALAESVALLLEAARPFHDLALVPLVVVGHDEGADVALHFALKYGAMLDACILMHPTQPPRTEAVQSLEGVLVLLCHAGPHDAIAQALSAAGAQVIAEIVPSFDAPRDQETAVCRVFLSTLFNLTRQETRGDW